ncbi:hypothetical protein FA15DRAFT_663277 [Coprinopsis marcescibilis]|uniref:Protein kinase domain-containing protein n=1 Tax=Coprinopsis marcescibilis TaxID=230819 RepID=A0A5C3LBC2_COPMA|nr:hypothetical protein FA15DRAFT_663277 [Coprinopsis marcescibilis]
MCWDSDIDTLPSPSGSSEASLDDDDVNCRLKPYWSKYHCLFNARGFHLETVRDVKAYYCRLQQAPIHHSIASILETKDGSSRDQELCPDPSLPDNLFRGRRICDGRPFIVKAVHSHSREHEAIRFLSHSPLRDDPRNHTIPVLDIFECYEDRVAFLVMEEWSSHLLSDYDPYCLDVFLSVMRQAIEHVAFMHQHRLAHLDISIRNLVTNCKGQCAFIDFELSRKYDSVANPRIQGYRATEVPPECETREGCDPFKIDVWALGVLILRVCKLGGFHVPELLQLTRPMLNDIPEHRPPMHTVLETYDRMLGPLRQRQRIDYPNNHSNPHVN